MFESSSVTRSLTPKRLLSERLLRSVAARNSAKVAPGSCAVALRPVGVRCVSASKDGLPRSYASGLEGPRNVLVGMFHTLKRTARARRVTRLAERFASSSLVALRPSVALRPVRVVVASQAPVAVRLH